MFLKLFQMCVMQSTFFLTIHITSFIYLENIVLYKKVQNFKYSWNNSTRMLPKRLFEIGRFCTKPFFTCRVWSQKLLKAISAFKECCKWLWFLKQVDIETIKCDTNSLFKKKQFLCEGGERFNLQIPLITAEIFI